MAEDYIGEGAKLQRFVARWSAHREGRFFRMRPLISRLAALHCKGQAIAVAFSSMTLTGRGSYVRLTRIDLVFFLN